VKGIILVFAHLITERTIGGRFNHFLREMEITTARRFTLEGVYSKINVSRALGRTNVFIMVILSGMGARYLIIRVF
jgi:hypothetical protein